VILSEYCILKINTFICLIRSLTNAFGTDKFTKLDIKTENYHQMCVKMQKKLLFLRIMYDKMKKVVQLKNKLYYLVSMVREVYAIILAVLLLQAGRAI